MPSRSKSTRSKVVPLRPELPPLPPAQLADHALPLEAVTGALADMAQLLSRASTGGETLRLQLSRVHALFKAQVVYVLEHDPVTRQLRVAKVRGRADARIRAVAPDEGAPGRAFTAEEVRREGDLVCAPLIGRNAPLGVLCVLGAKREVTDAVITALAAQVSAGFDVAELRDEMQRRNKDLETALAGRRSLEQHRDQLLGNLSHDLKTPLTPIKAWLGLLGRQRLGPLSEEQRAAVLKCERNTDRLLRLVDDLILMSRLQSGKMQLADKPVALRALVERTVKALSTSAELAGVHLRLSAGSETYVRGDAERLTEAAFLMVEHALNRCASGERVDIDVAVRDGLAAISVRDSGDILAEEDLEGLFTPFVQARRGRNLASSLGMPLVSRIAKLHGGRAEATSESGGTAVHLLLPLFAGALDSPEDAAPEPRSGGILLVEDDADCREVLSQVLTEEGYRVMEAASASEAHSLLAHIRPALVLLDLRLRDGDGREVLRTLRSTPGTEDVPVYIVSGASDLGSLSRGEGPDRIDGYFEKPLVVSKLLDTVSAVVRPAKQLAR
ncbi:MAG TPA: hybrid sensor histidine kinase/response regulator [Myxococcaceae bacterium]|nr:hybrid sensor histidine kinase/response regulator [Myxococcaceae bacterium]